MKVGATQKTFGNPLSWLLPTIRIHDIPFGMTLPLALAGAKTPDLDRAVDARLFRTAIARG
ncbi:hypothetical protein EAH89_15735 [Roseomonas nepalensis]|uniref:Uncharacterized protein n=1 Tax=Muricoccus nepalensis TaxID=1854500 RepID=A0A502FX68_9PROT|nr:hypothetical protein EAH89_15735 [Roseomonas nepalensis]